MKRLVLLALLCFLFVISKTQNSTTSEENDKHWNFEISPYFWASSVNSNKEIGPVSFSQDTRFKDVFSNMVYAVPVRFKFGKNHWSLVADILYVKDALNQSAQYTFFPKLPDKSTVKFSSSYTISKLQAEAFGAYTFKRNKRKHVNCKLDALLGARFTQQKNLLELQQESSLDTLDIFPVSHTEQYIDPLIGVSYTLLFLEKWKFYLMGNIGGFSVGSKFTSELVGDISFEAAKFIELNFGYRWIYTDFENGNDGMDHYSNKSNEFGPMLSITFKW